VRTWGFVEAETEPQAGQLYTVILEEQAENGATVTDVFLFVPKLRVPKGWRGIRYDVPSTFVPLEDVLLQVPITARVTEEYTFYKLPEALKVLDTVGTNLVVGPFLTEYHGPREDYAALMMIVRATGRISERDLLSYMQRTSVRSGQVYDAEWLINAARVLRKEGYGLWRDPDGYYYVSADAPEEAVERERAIAQAVNLADVYVPPYVWAAQGLLEAWIRRIVRQELSRGKQHDKQGHGSGKGKK